MCFPSDCVHTELCISSMIDLFKKFIINNLILYILQCIFYTNLCCTSKLYIVIIYMYILICLFYHS